MSSSLAEVTEILDRHIDNNNQEDADGDGDDVNEIDEKNLKRKRISFNVPGIELTTEENENEAYDDDDEDRSKIEEEK